MLSSYLASRGCIFTVWAGVRKVASADNRSNYIVHAWNSSRNSQAKLIIRSVIKWHKFCGIKKNCDNSDLLCQTHTMLKTGQEQEKTRFFDLFVQISGRIWMVVGRGYFSHDSSRSENVESARRVVSGSISMFDWGVNWYVRVWVCVSGVRCRLMIWAYLLTPCVNLNSLACVDNVL